MRVRSRGNPRTWTMLRAAVSPALIFAMLYGASAPYRSFAQDAAESQRQEYNLKLAFLFNFGRYVSWPAEAFAASDAPFVVGVLGPDPFAGALERVAASHKIQGRTIAVRHFAAAGDYQPCQLLFITVAAGPAERDAVLNKTATAAVLVVGEADGFAVAGGGVNFYRDQENVRFELNLDALRAHKLQTDAKLIKLARIVKGN
jgi:hypothetical protein